MSKQIYYLTIVFCLCCFTSINSIQAQITLMGDIRQSNNPITYNGTDNPWEVTGANGLGIGHFGQGSMSVAGGFVVNSGRSRVGGPGATFAGVAVAPGIVTVTDVGSQWNISDLLSVSSAGDGTLNVEAGGVVSSAAGLIGDGSSTIGVATVTGAGSQWNTGTMTVGHFGHGILNIETGGVVSSSTGQISDISGGTGIVTVTGSGSQWNSTFGLNVGRDGGDGTLNVTAGGMVSSTTGTIASFGSSSTGTASVTGSGSQWNISSGLTIGGGGAGTLNIQNSGRVTVGGTLKIWNDGAINLESGILAAQAFDLSEPDATLNFNGGILAVPNIIGDLTQNGGVLAPGDSPGTTTISENYFLNSGTLAIELAGTTQGTEYDFLDVTGMANLNGGDLDVRFLDDFENLISMGDYFTILEADGGLNGEFAGLPNGSTGFTFNGLGSFKIDYGSNSVVLSNFAAVTVPEPSSISLLGIAIAGCGFGRRRRR